MNRHDYTLYDQNIVLEDRIRNKTLNGIVEYHKVLNLVKIYLNAKYVYVKLAVDSVAVDPEEATVTIKWSVNGMGMIKVRQSTSIFYYYGWILWHTYLLEELYHNVRLLVPTTSDLEILALVGGLVVNGPYETMYLYNPCNAFSGHRTVHSQTAL